MNDGTEYGVPKAMIPEAKTFLVNLKNMDLAEDQDALFVRYRHRAGNFASTLIADAILYPDAGKQEQRMQEKLNKLVQDDPKIQPLIDRLSADLSVKVQVINPKNFTPNLNPVSIIFLTLQSSPPSLFLHNKPLNCTHFVEKFGKKLLFRFLYEVAYFDPLSIPHWDLLRPRPHLSLPLH